MSDNTAGSSGPSFFGQSFELFNEKMSQPQVEAAFQGQTKEASKWAPQSLFAAMKDTWFIESFESGMVRVIVMEPPKTHKYAYLTVPEVKFLIQSLQLACDAVDFKNKSEMPYTPQIPPEAQPTGLVQTPGVMQLVDDSPPSEDDF